MPGAIVVFATLIFAATGALAGLAVRVAAILLPERILGLAEPLACPECGHSLPVISQLPGFAGLPGLRIGGKHRCAGCGATLHPGFPTVELVLAVLFAAVFALWGGAGAALWLLAATVLLALLVVIDLEFMIVPDLIVAVLIVPILGLALVSGLTVAQMAVGAVVFGLGAFLIRLAGTALKGQEPLGLGDVKLLAVLGLATPPALWGEFMLAAGLAGIVTSRLPAVAQQRAFPFAPALAAAFVATSLLRLPWR